MSSYYFPRWLNLLKTIVLDLTDGAFTSRLHTLTQEGRLASQVQVSGGGGVGEQVGGQVQLVVKVGA